MSEQEEVIYSECDEHGRYEGEGICMLCYAEQQERVERESPALRLEVTSEKLRARAVEELARRNGGYRDNPH